MLMKKIDYTGFHYWQREMNICNNIKMLACEAIETLMTTLDRDPMTQLQHQQYIAI